MKYADVSGLSDKDLMKKSKELRTQMFEARMKNALGQLANPMTIRELRRDVARLKTAATAKVVAAAKTAAPAKAAAPKAKAKPAAKKAASKGKAK
ncbi:MAG: 50S ribosomal protein L29 [Bdellovibrionota bacterium]